MLFDAEALRAASGPGGRVIIFAFVRAVPIMLERLLDVNTAPDSLRNICIVALPLPDTMPRAGGTEEIRVSAAVVSPTLRHVSYWSSSSVRLHCLHAWDVVRD